MWTRAFHARCYENRAKCSGEKYNRDASSNSKLEQCFRAACNGYAASCCTAQWLRTAQWLPSRLEQQFRAHSGDCASSSSGFVQPAVATQHPCGRYSVCVCASDTGSVRQIRCLCSRDCVCAVDTVHMRQTHCLCGRYSVCVVDTVSVRQIQGLCDRSSDFECTMVTERA